MPNWIGESNQAGANCGFSVSKAGDINGDGYDDILIGAHRYDNFEIDEGRTFLYYGSASGLLLTPIWYTESNQDWANMGFCVSTAVM